MLKSQTTFTLRSLRCLWAGVSVGFFATKYSPQHTYITVVLRPKVENELSIQDRHPTCMSLSVSTPCTFRFFFHSAVYGST